MYEYKGEEYDFIFTIFDDTDSATVENVKPVYDLLNELNIKTTKSVWSLPVKEANVFSGETLDDKNYLDFVLDIKDKGFEIAMHNVGSGHFIRKEIRKGLQVFNERIGHYPRVHVNHATNSDNIFWGAQRFSFPFNIIYRLLSKGKFFTGERPDSPLFWGDLHKEHIKYTRNYTFNDLNTFKNDPYMPYIEASKLYASNYWFSSTDTSNVDKFNATVTKKSIDRLKDENGICILYVHFASAFVMNGKLNPEFEEALRYLSTLNGLFLNVSDTLDYILERRLNKQAEKPLSKWEKLGLDFRFFKNRYLKA